MNIIKHRNIFFAFSLVLIIPGIIALLTWHLKLGIDFEGGTLWEVKFSEVKDAQKAELSQVSKYISATGIEVSQATTTNNKTSLFRLKVTDDTKIKELKEKINKDIAKTEDIRLDTIGPVISKELTQKAFTTTIIAILAIVVYVTWAFRKVPKPASPLSFGVCTIIALIHDVAVVAGIFAILGHFFNVEVDSLFITALLTVLGFSVHDTIVVFDRIRENLKKYGEYSFEEVVNHSVLQTFARSLNTSLTVVFVLLALLLFGGESIRSFVLALLVGVVSGTYSSIFNAAPLLVVWQKLSSKRKK